jgi:hypothetical protein
MVDGNHDFLAKLNSVIDGWCDQRNYKLLAQLLPSYVACNGLTDGFEDLRFALKSVRSAGYDEIGEQDWYVLDELIRAIDFALKNR